MNKVCFICATLIFICMTACRKDEVALVQKIETDCLEEDSVDLEGICSCLSPSWVIDTLKSRYLSGIEVIGGSTKYRYIGYVLHATDTEECPFFCIYNLVDSSIFEGVSFFTSDGDLIDYQSSQFESLLKDLNQGLFKSCQANRKYLRSMEIPQ